MPDLTPRQWHDKQVDLFGECGECAACDRYPDARRRHLRDNTRRGGQGEVATANDPGCARHAVRNCRNRLCRQSATLAPRNYTSSFIGVLERVDSTFNGGEVVISAEVRARPGAASMQVPAVAEGPDLRGLVGATVRVTYDALTRLSTIEPVRMDGPDFGALIIDDPQNVCEHHPQGSVAPCSVCHAPGPPAFVRAASRTPYSALVNTDIEIHVTPEEAERMRANIAALPSDTALRVTLDDNGNITDMEATDPHNPVTMRPVIGIDNQATEALERCTRAAGALQEAFAAASPTVLRAAEVIGNMSRLMGAAMAESLHRQMYEEIQYGLEER